MTAATALALSTAAVGAPAGAEGDPVPPVAGRTVAEFDPPDPDWMPGHRGIDLAGEPGEPVSTPRAGVVAFVGLVGSVPVVVVRHGIARATYQPVSSDLAPGDLVAAGA